MNRLLPFLLTLMLAAVGSPLIAQTQDTTVVDVIANSENHDTLETAIIAAGLDSTLRTAGPFTVFAPTDSAFAALPMGMLDSLLADSTGSLADLLRLHVVRGEFMASQLMDSMRLGALSGDSLLVTVMGDTIMVNGVMIGTPDLMASNGVVHSLDGILMPMVEDTSVSVRQEPAFAREVTISPNPARSYLNVGLPVSIVNRAILTLRDMNGRTVLTRLAASERESLQVGSLPDGMYLLEIRSGREAIQRKVSIHR